MLPWLRHRWLSLYLLSMALSALMLFLYGFFPLKYHSGHMASMNDLPNFIEGVSIDGQEVYNAGPHSVVLMVIDGLRYDFVTEEYMPYTGQLLKNKSACIYVTIAEPPTVTMPRIKSPQRKVERAQWRRTINFWRNIYTMMTGSVSTFADVALNFGAPEVQGDSVLRVAAGRGRRTVMYGDDTWLRLFPGLWSESDGTTSFYVTDYTEVDNNVTRHLDNVLNPDDKKQPTFDFLVLHYLGLDHIGHLEGARSPKIKPKLIEMDDIVKRIYTAMNEWDRPGVLFVVGDHGMRDAGGHGGSTTAEVLVPMVVAKSGDFQCPHETGGLSSSQADIAAAISWLLRAPLPGDCAGRPPPAILPSDVTQQLYLLHYVATHNAKAVERQIGAIAKDKEFYKQYQRAQKQFAQYLTTRQQSAAKIAKEFYEESLDVMSKYLLESTVEFDMFAIVTAILLMYAILSALVCVTLHSLQDNNRRKYSITNPKKKSKAGAIVAFLFILISFSFILTLACAITETESNLCTLYPPWVAAFLAVVAIFTVTFFVTKTANALTFDLRILKHLNSIDMLLIFCTLFHPWTFFGTSFIEEEHMTWYFFWNTLMFFVLVRTFVVLVMYFSKKFIGATEVQDKPLLDQKMNVGIGILPKWVLLIALHRYLRTMNQTGDRWLFLPDTADWLNAPENAIYLKAHLLIGTITTIAICLYNLKYTNNVWKMHVGFTLCAGACIFLYRILEKSTEALPGLDFLDAVSVVNVFWTILFVQMICELLTFVGNFRMCSSHGNPNYGVASNNKFVYNKRKDKTEDYTFNDDEDPWNLDEVKLNLARSISHLVLNNMMLIIVLLMRPHNVIMVPSIYFTSVLTLKCLQHNLLDSKPDRNNEALDILGDTLVHVWIGFVFFYYQGNSNSLASVDLGAGYVGLREYSAARVAARMGLHAYAGPALAGAQLYCRLALAAGSWGSYLQSVWRSMNIFALQRVYTLVVYILVATVFRHHLFVWTVFSPKLLYDFVNTVFTLQALVTIGEIIAVTHVTSWFARLVARRKL